MESGTKNNSEFFYPIGVIAAPGYMLGGLAVTQNITPVSHCVRREIRQATEKPRDPEAFKVSIDFE